MHYVQVWTRGLIEGMVGGWWLLDGMFHQQLATQNATFEETHKKSHRLRLDRMACFCLKLENCPFPPIQNSTPPHPLADPGQNRIRDGHREAVKGKLGYYGLVQNALALPCCKDEQIKFSSFGGWRICIFFVDVFNQVPMEWLLNEIYRHLKEDRTRRLSRNDKKQHSKFAFGMSVEWPNNTQMISNDVKWRHRCVRHSYHSKVILPFRFYSVFWQ